MSGHLAACSRKDLLLHVLSLCRYDGIDHLAGAGPLVQLLLRSLPDFRSPRDFAEATWAIAKWVAPGILSSLSVGVITSQRV